jgi:hypothetical protein
MQQLGRGTAAGRAQRFHQRAGLLGLGLRVSDAQHGGIVGL